MTTAELQGLRVLVVEDDALVAMLLEDMLGEFGCEVVGPAGTLTQALDLAKDSRIDAAVLDVNLAGQPVFPVAGILKARGVPFVFASGYGEAGLSPEHEGTPALQKPFRDIDLYQALAGLQLPSPGPA